MASANQFARRPADRRGLGLTFLGMMAQDESVLEIRGIVFREQFEAMVINLNDQIAELRRYVMTPWYVKFWNEIKRLLHIARKK